jgi:hypothetical protein
MDGVVSEDTVRREFDKIEESADLVWLQEHLDYTTRPLLSEPWILDIDTTMKPLYGHQQGAVVSSNPHKPGRPSHDFAEIDGGAEVWEYAVLVNSLSCEILPLASSIATAPTAKTASTN